MSEPLQVKQVVDMLEGAVEAAAGMLLLLSPIGFVLGSMGVVFSDYPAIGWFCIATTALGMVVGFATLRAFSEENHE